MAPTNQQAWQITRDPGMTPIDEFLTLQNQLEYQSCASDIGAVRRILCHKGMRIELALDIMGLTGYEPKQRFKPEHGPFHPVIWLST